MPRNKRKNIDFDMQLRDSVGAIPATTTEQQRKSVLWVLKNYGTDLETIDALGLTGTLHVMLRERAETKK